MDEHSQAYKDFMRSDEAKGLQRGREFGIGDWYIPCPERPEPRLIKNRLDMSCRRVDWIKLPSLFQLIRIIEGAGYDVSSTWSWRTGERQHRYVAMRPEENGLPYCYIESSWETDRMLAAAKLAARAVEGKG